VDFSSGFIRPYRAMQAIFFNKPIKDNYLGNQFAEVYKERIYAPFLMDKKDLTIVDIGSNIGITTYYFSQFAKRVVAVEPAKEHFEVLTKMVEFNELKNVTLVNKAIYMKAGEFPLFHPRNENKTMYSLHSAIKAEEEEVVQAITLEDLFKQEKLDHVDLLKMDIEGSETEVLSSDSFKAVSDKIDLIVVERHYWNGRNPNQLVEALKNNGFTIEAIPSQDNEILTLLVGRKK